MKFFGYYISCPLFCFNILLLSIIFFYIGKFFNFGTVNFTLISFALLFFHQTLKFRVISKVFVNVTVLDWLHLELFIPINILFDIFYILGESLVYYRLL